MKPKYAKTLSQFYAMKHCLILIDTNFAKKMKKKLNFQKKKVITKLIRYSTHHIAVVFTHKKLVE